METKEIEMKPKNKNQGKAWFEITLLVIGIFAFSYILRESGYGLEAVGYISRGGQKLGYLSMLSFGLKILIKTIFSEKNLVSALEASDLREGVSTCIKGRDGSLCQEYVASECKNKCAGECLPSRSNVPQCKLGTCFDPRVGTCSERATKENCESKGGQWFDDPAGNIAECQKACCVVGDDVRPLVTTRECKNIEEVEGITTKYRPEIKNELSCLALSHTKAEGACIFQTSDEKKCKFIIKEECLKNKGEFYEGFLCTHPDLKMTYKKQATAKCVEGKDEIYWFDSEGNRENIYNANKVKSWGNGRILPKSEGCDLGKDLKNQKECGNCNRLLGSVCGEKTAKEKLSDNSINIVCRDMRCVDKQGNVRENGERWCEYQGNIGAEKGARGFERSVDTPGSTHFIATCFDGNVEVDPCADYRNEICTESKIKSSNGKEISNAACITNLWQLCLQYNAEVKGDTKAERQAAMETRNDKCIKNPHCILKKVDAADNFKFEMCVPKYAPGFDLRKNAEGGELSCAFANQKCTVIYVKEIGGWKTKVNEGCLKEEFAQQMNDLCMSMGDCGAKVNYEGDLTLNYKVKNTKKLKDKYLNEIKEYSEPVKGKIVETNVSAYIDAVGGIGKLRGKKIDPECNLPFGCELVPDTDILNIAGTISGATGTVAPIAGYLLPSIAGYSTILAAVAIGFAITSLLIKYTGIEGGLDPAVTWALIGAGTIGAGILGLAASGIGSVGAGSGLAIIKAGLAAGIFLLWAAVILIALVIITIVIFKAMGVGDTKKKVVTFQCQPWQQPLGGTKCSECGKDGYKCSKYACQSFGQTCELINEGSREEKCIDLGENDVSSPVILPWEAVLTKGFHYEKNSNGMKIVSDANDGCLSSYQNVVFGINLNEPGYCRYTTQHTNNFDEMDQEEDGFDFGDRNLYLYNHSQLFTIPDLTSLGAPGYDPNRRADFNLYLRCRDGQGNGEQAQEYVVNFCVKPGEDKTPPIVTGREPYSEFVRFNAATIDGSIFVNEPAECKWDTNRDEDYDKMENKMECENDVQDRGSLLGWKCESTFNLDKNENVFYIKCKDQPWLAGDESKRNIMSDPYEFKIKKTENQLVISFIKPHNENLTLGVQPATVILEAQTKGGVDNGKATCKLFGREIGETFGTTHKQIFDQIITGEYEFPIICEDSVGNSAQNISKFKVELDITPPKVARVYDKSGTLTIVTNENSTCSFIKGGNIDNCGFEFLNGTLMSGNEKIHSAGFDGNMYYVKCRDNWKNTPGSCSVIVGKGGVI